MKQTIILLALSIIMMSCATTKTERAYEKVINGHWTLSTITYDRAGTYKVNLFGDSKMECFKDSKWQFVRNNNSGKYNISDGSCANGDRYFVFTIQEIDKEAGLYDLLLKPTNKKQRSESDTGFRFKLASISEDMMHLQQTSTVDGRSFVISLKYYKN